MAAWRRAIKSSSSIASPTFYPSMERPSAVAIVASLASRSPSATSMTTKAKKTPLRCCKKMKFPAKTSRSWPAWRRWPRRISLRLSWYSSTCGSRAKSTRPRWKNAFRRSCLTRCGMSSRSCRSCRASWLSNRRTSLTRLKCRSCRLCSAISWQGLSFLTAYLGNYCLL